MKILSSVVIEDITHMNNGIMNIQPLNSETSSLAAPSSNLDNEDVDDKRHIVQSGTTSYSSETKSLVDRSAIQATKVSGPELQKLILEQNFSNDVHYQVDGDLALNGCTGLRALPENQASRPVLAQRVKQKDNELWNENTASDRVVSNDEWQVLWLIMERKKLPDKPAPLIWLFQTIAKLGGWCDSKHTGRPGWLAFWKGWANTDQR